ncbi:MAG: DUF3592 domain-containing protein [Ruminococcaceae bacterium]|nr:DUF3592 domain-containing protein [Oscillospiraceae bacterium]
MEKLKKIIFSVIAVVIGIALIAYGIYSLSTKHLYDSSVTATIVDVEESWESDGDGSDHLVKTFYIDYEINGVKYEHVESPVSEDSMKVGDTVEILYQSKNPEKISEKDISKTAAIIIGVGALLLIVGIFLVIKALMGR